MAVRLLASHPGELTSSKAGRQGSTDIFLRDKEQGFNKVTDSSLGMRLNIGLLFTVEVNWPRVESRAEQLLQQ